MESAAAAVAARMMLAHQRAKPRPSSVVTRTTYVVSACALFALVVGTWTSQRVGQGVVVNRVLGTSSTLLVGRQRSVDSRAAEGALAAALGRSEASASESPASKSRVVPTVNNRLELAVQAHAAILSGRRKLRREPSPSLSPSRTPAPPQRYRGPSQALAPPAAPLPSACIGTAGFHIERDVECYLAAEASARAEASSSTSADVPYCFGDSGMLDSTLFHTVILDDAPPAATRLLVMSFLATQCCDAVLWVWLPQGMTSRVGVDEALPLPPANHEGRVVYKETSVAALFADVRDDFPDVNDTAAAAMENFKDIRFRANWARILILYTYGGIYVDLDTMFLRDFRALLLLTNDAFTYRQGSETTMNIAVLKLYRQPDKLTRDLIAWAAKAHAVSQSALSKSMEPWHPKSPWNRGVIAYVALPLFDIVWLRFIAGLRLRVSGPEVGPAEALKAQGGAAMVAAMDRVDGFTVDAAWKNFFNSTTEAAMERRRGQLFFPGALSYHWHKSAHRVIPARSWAALLLERFEAIVSRKSVCLQQQH